VEFNQIYKAPSISKLSKRTISSPFGERSAVSTPKLKKTSFSFIKGIQNIPTSIFQKPQTEEGQETQKESSISKVLNETNRILVEIQNQLAADFTSRISEEKKLIEKIKKEKYQRRLGSKQDSLSGPQKIVSGLIGQVDQILAPTKSIFDKIKEFFGIILTGIIVNNAFKWLQKKENREKLVQIFQFVADHWKELLILFGTFKLLKFLFAVISIGSKIKRLFNFWSKKPPGPGGGQTPNICNALLNCFGNKAVVTSLSQSLLKNAIFTQGVRGLVAAKPQPRTAPRTSPPLTPAPVRSPVGGRQPGTPATQPKPWWQQGAPPEWLVRPSGVDPFKMPTAEQSLEKLLNIGGAYGASLLPRLLPFLRTLLPSVVGAAEGGTIEKPKKKCTACSLGFSTGGTVGGRGKPKADDVPAMLSTGEEVVNTASSMLWRPLLKDINDNAGRLFGQFREAVIRMLDIVGDQKKNLEIFREITEEFNNYLQKQIREKSLSAMGQGGGTGGSISSKSLFGQAGIMQPKTEEENQNLLKGFNQAVTSTQNLSSIGNLYKQSLDETIQPSGVQINIKPSVLERGVAISRPVRRGATKPVIIPTSSPPIVGKMPEISMPSKPATDVPAIPSTNMANPYMYLTPEIYGIHVV
jgi:hypothetical protein